LYWFITSYFKGKREKRKYKNNVFLSIKTMNNVYTVILAYCLEGIFMYMVFQRDSVEKRKETKKSFHRQNNLF